MKNYDAGHSHGPTPHLVTGCPLCDADKAARDRAIGHLSEALRLLSAIQSDDARPTVRLNIAPIGITGEDTGLCRSIDLTAKQAESLSDVVDSLSASSRRTTDVTARVAPSEDIASGEWSAAAVAQCTPDLYADVTDVFDDLDYRAITRDVLDHTEGSKPKLAKMLLLDDWFGEIADPYADEDDA
ncbi:hypothetical protein [Streptomyces scabiei]|uniref:hypothetical protein n=1 Tax=Streptomyces scabiei TaxID=1930 RepID=UPI0029AA5048|nr:hypothetical protein [Streptomyces scabiei]MDX3279067.1 hypothetical protein [Streptomyces scabiei]MDX3279080.1 hypothetical protein [Streptomyces scabiei]